MEVTEPVEGSWAVAPTTTTHESDGVSVKPRHRAEPTLHEPLAAEALGCSATVKGVESRLRRGRVIGMCNDACLDFISSSLTADDVQDKSVLEVGSYDVNGSARRIIEGLRPSEYVGVDVTSGPGVDRVVPAERLVEYFGSETFSIVVSTEMLEHVRDWRAVVSNLKRVLRPGGLLVITTRSRGFAYHGYPADFWRFEESDIRRIFSDMDLNVVEADPVAPGVFVRARKPGDFQEVSTKDVTLYSIVVDERVADVTNAQEWFFLLRHRARLKVSSVTPDIVKRVVRTSRAFKS